MPVSSTAYDSIGSVITLTLNKMVDRIKINLVVLVVTILCFRTITCGCKQSFMTICDSFEDLEKYKDKENLEEVIIGSDDPTRDPNFTSVSLMDALPLGSFNKLTSLIIIRKINKLDVKTYAYQCTYYNSPLKYLKLYGNELKQIEPYHFPVVPLKKLSLVNNKIEAMKPWAFLYHEIENFDASDNLLEVVENQSLPSTTATKVISLRNNKLSHIEPGSFTTSLRSLNLDKNKLRYLQKEILANLTNLEELTLSQNNFNEIPEISHLTNLVIFDISSNQINAIPSGIFEHMNNLKLLDLSNNGIADSNVLMTLILPDKQPSLIISFALNRLRNLNMTGVVLQEQKFILYGNPWSCDDWNSLKNAIKGHESECDSKFLASGNVSYCINYRSGSYPFVSQWDNDVDRLRIVVKNASKSFTCKLDPLGNHLLDPVNFGCVA